MNSAAKTANRALIINEVLTALKQIRKEDPEITDVTVIFSIKPSEEPNFAFLKTKLY
ncbi:MAG: hypothetical protein GYB35_16160 [Algicola sp.]|nr:hypothetical protein [Algicola sp.]